MYFVWYQGLNFLVWFIMYVATIKIRSSFGYLRVLKVSHLYNFIVQRKNSLKR